MTTPRIEFTWSLAKEAANVAKHQVSFAQAATVFRDPLTLTVYDRLHSEREDRWFSLGTASEGLLLAVSHTYAFATPSTAYVRIISARRSTRMERRQYEGLLR